MNWNGKHIYKVGTNTFLEITNPELEIENQKKQIEPWLSAVFQSEHLALLLGSGLTLAVANQSGTQATTMQSDYTNFTPFEAQLAIAALNAAKEAGRGTSNIEDQIRVTNILKQGLEILEHQSFDKISNALDALQKEFLDSISETERNVKKALIASSHETYRNEENKHGDKKEKLNALVMLVSFLLSFSSRTATRERLHIFTTNYDRLIEMGADAAGLHIIDRFVGNLEPYFRSSRLEIDMHYNPPGIRGEPRYLEGVVKLTKLHGSLDWVYKNKHVRKIPLPFGPAKNHTSFIENPGRSVMIYPNSAKDRETSEYPYVELFRDYASAVCRPNSVLVTFGYGFGDDHINRTIVDMLTIPSTHLVIISFDDAGGRISEFYKNEPHKAQISLLIGNHFGNMDTLVENYLPKPAIDLITMRQTVLLNNRGWDTNTSDASKEDKKEQSEEK